jgi:hypothetical protein
MNWIIVGRCRVGAGAGAAPGRRAATQTMMMTRTARAMIDLRMSCSY